MTQARFKYDAVVPPGLSAERVQDALKKRRARKVGEIPRGHTQLREEVWEYENGDRVRIVDDHLVAVRSLRAESVTSGRPADVIFELRDELGLQEIDDLIDLGASSEPHDSQHAIRGLAAITSRYRGDTVKTISAGLKDPDPNLRATALRAIARWPHFAFVRELDAMSVSEIDPELRREARALAEDVRKHGYRGSS